MHQHIGKVLSGLLCIMCALPLQAQTKHQYPAGKGPEDFPALVYTPIAGAPKLGKPMLCMGDTKPVLGEGMGWASPAFMDMNGDGKKDLLIGEFGTGLEHTGLPLGNFVRIYTNEGTSEKPVYTDAYNYLWIKENESPGTPASIYTWCCMAFTPRIVDLDDDGFDDIVTGQFNPGHVTLFRGSEDGFHAGVKLKQLGNPNMGATQRDLTIPRTDTNSIDYWSYSAVAFGDFNGQGKQDMIVGGTALRISRNTGTKTNPEFGLRELLLDTKGQPLMVFTDSAYPAMDGKNKSYGACMVPYVADWDNDGQLDLLVTDCYIMGNTATVTFFRGVKGGRFEAGVPLFTAKNGQKAFPGTYPNICVTDWNNDGVNDLVIGASVPTLKGKFDHALAWEWEIKTDIIKKNPAYNSLSFTRLIEQQMADADKYSKKSGMSDDEAEKKNYATRRSLFKHYYGKEEYKTLAHQGYVYVMLGSK